MREVRFWEKVHFHFFYRRLLFAGNDRLFRGQPEGQPVVRSDAMYAYRFPVCFCGVAFV